MLIRLSIVLTLLAIVLIAPFALRPDSEEVGLEAGGGERLVIITPHNESIQAEFGRAFARHMKETEGRDVFLDWRQPGGTSEIAKFLKSEYTTRFENLWKKETGLPFSRKIRDGFQDRRMGEILTRVIQEGYVDDLTGSGPDSLDERTDEEIAAIARALFLRSTIGVGIDLFFGGGAYDFSRQASIGTLVSHDESGKLGPAALMEQHPEWFSDEIMPASVSGEPFRDKDLRWVGTVLSSFGIVYNEDVLKRLGFDEPVSQWDDLADPRLFGQVALADPTKSGSTTKAFEMLIQEQIQRLLANEGMSEPEAVSQGWDLAMRMILKISANSRYFTDSAAKVPRDVALGDAAAGMCIDFYGRTFNEIYRSDDGSSHVQFVMPQGGTSIGADPIGMLRGAPSPDLAHRFIEFVLSPEGQKLWNFQVGSPGGPQRYALRRPPIRRDFYQEENQSFQTDPEVNPYEIAEGFTYHPEWTGSLFASLRFVIKAACIDPHEEQQAAWESVRLSGKENAGWVAFEDVSLISYEAVKEKIAPALNQKNKVVEIQLAREISSAFRLHYEQIANGESR